MFYNMPSVSEITGFSFLFSVLIAILLYMITLLRGSKIAIRREGEGKRIRLIEYIPREQYYFTEEGQLTYYSNLKKNRLIIFGGPSLILFLIFKLMFSTPYQNEVNLSNVLTFAFFSMTIIMAVFSYIYSNIIFYYLIPLVPLLYSLYVFDYRNLPPFLYIEGMGVLILFSVSFYCIMAFSLPLPAIRKLLSLSGFLDILLSILITLFFKSVIVKMEPFFYNRTVISGPLLTIENFNELISTLFLKDIKVDWLAVNISNILEGLGNGINIYKVQHMESVFNLSDKITFSILSSYSIARIIFGLKDKLGKAKAREIYENLQKQSNVSYSVLRDCIFYGGEKYQDKIFSNREYKNTIISTEQGFEFYVEKRNWVIGISRFAQNVVGFLKKLI